MQRRITPLQILAPRAGSHVAATAKVVVIGNGRGPQSVAKVRHAHVETLTSEQAYVYATSHDVSVIVVNADVNGVQLVQTLRAVFPSTAVIAISRHAATRAAAQRSGAIAVPASTTAVQLTALIDGLI